MRERMKSLRQLLVRNLHAQGASRDFSFVEKQKGMFSYLCISPEQVRKVREEASVYFVDSSRVNIAGINLNNVEPLAKALVSVL
jgi:aspartate aminotransferase